MPFIVIRARNAKYNLLGHIEICFYNKGKTIMIIITTNIYQMHPINMCQSLFQVYYISHLILVIAL